MNGDRTPIPLRTDLVDLYVARPTNERSAPFELLQIRRTTKPASGTWHPMMGHVEFGETAIQTLVREAHEELGLDLHALARRATDEREPSPERLWALEQVHPFFVPELNAILASPRFVALVQPGWEPMLNDEHDAARWVGAPVAFETANSAALTCWLWPGQRAAVCEACAVLLAGAVAAGDDANRRTADLLRVERLVLSVGPPQRSA